MGAWGTGPFENDTASDWLAKIKLEAAIAKALQAADLQTIRVKAKRGSGVGLVDQSSVDEALAAIELLVCLASNGHADPDLLERAEDVLTDLLAADYPSMGWKSPARMRTELERQVVEVGRLLTAYRRRMREKGR